MYLHTNVYLVLNKGKLTFSSDHEGTSVHFLDRPPYPFFPFHIFQEGVGSLSNCTLLIICIAKFHTLFHAQSCLCIMISIFRVSFTLALWFCSFCKPLSGGQIYRAQLKVTNVDEKNL